VEGEPVLSALILAAALTSASPIGAPPDALDNAIKHFRTVESYRVTIRSIHADGEEHIRYYYKKPGFVRMEFIRPHAGSVMIYSPDTKRVGLWPLGAGNFPKLSLSPENSIIRSLSGMRVDRSDVGTLLENIRALREQGSTRMLGEETADGRTDLHFIVTGREGLAVDDVHSSELWLDAVSQFPIKVISRDIHDAIIETVVMEALEINGKLPEALFNP
jgi:outer membrane lipoprotein-sorting protein